MSTIEIIILIALILALAGAFPAWRGGAVPGGIVTLLIIVLLVLLLMRRI